MWRTMSQVGSSSGYTAPSAEEGPRSISNFPAMFLGGSGELVSAIPIRLPACGHIWKDSFLLAKDMPRRGRSALTSSQGEHQGAQFTWPGKGVSRRLLTGSLLPAVCLWQTCQQQMFVLNYHETTWTCLIRERILSSTQRKTLQHAAGQRNSTVFLWKLCRAIWRAGADVFMNE